MADIFDDAFYKRADAHIALANDEVAKQGRGAIGLIRGKAGNGSQAV